MKDFNKNFMKINLFISGLKSEQFHFFLIFSLRPVFSSCFSQSSVFSLFYAVLYCQVEIVTSGLLTFDCRGPRGTQATVDVIDNLDGTYSMNIMPKEAGKHRLEIKYDSEHIHNSPYLVRLLYTLTQVHDNTPPPSLKTGTSLTIPPLAFGT